MHPCKYFIWKSVTIVSNRVVLGLVLKSNLILLFLDQLFCNALRVLDAFGSDSPAKVSSVWAIMALAVALRSPGWRDSSEKAFCRSWQLKKSNPRRFWRIERRIWCCSSDWIQMSMPMQLEGKMSCYRARKMSLSSWICREPEGEINRSIIINI